MVKNALDRLDARLVEAGHPGLREQLAPGRPERDVQRELDGLGLSSVDDLAAWFTYHDGGWLEPDKLQLLSLDDAIEHRMDLSQDLLVPFRSSWFPIKTDSTESHVVDTATGAFLFYDLETGDDEARQLAPSFSDWIDAIALGTSGRFAASTRATWSKQWSAENTEELKDEAQRALRGLAGLARRAADWIEDKEAKLGEHESSDADDQIDTGEGRASPSEPEPGPPASTVTGATTGRVAVHAPASSWKPTRGRVEDFEVLNDGRILAIANHSAGIDMYGLDPASGLAAELVAEIPEKLGSRGLRVSPSSTHVLVNGAWLYDLDSRSGGHVGSLVEASQGRGSVSVAWADDGQRVHVLRTDRLEAGPRSKLFEVDLRTLDARMVREINTAAVLAGACVVTTTAVPGGPNSLRVEEIDGTQLVELQGGLAATFLLGSVLVSTDGTKVAVPTVGNRGFGLVDMSTGSAKFFDQLHPRAITKDGSAIFAIQTDYPTSPCFMINTTTCAIEPFGLPDIEDAKFDMSGDGTRFAHHVVGPDRKLAIEYIDWNLGISSVLPMTSNDPYEAAVAIRFCGDAVVFYDHRADGEATYRVSPITSGQLGPAVDIGDSARVGTTVHVSEDQSHIAWRTDQGIRWCASDGTGLRALRMRDGTKMGGWVLTARNQVVVNSHSHIGLATMS